MKKFIVTGGSGFIGSNLVKFLLKKKYFVINVDKLSYSANSYNLKEVKKHKNYKFFKIDINDKTRLLRILNKYQPIGIFNLAAETHVDRSIDDPKNFIKTNILGVYNLLIAMKNYLKRNKKRIKLIHISTDEVYGDIPLNKKSDEKFSYNPSSPYSASKASADHLIKSFFRTYKIPAVISNCCNNYGPNQFPEKFIPKLIYNIISNKSLPIYGKGENLREWMHVTDHCKALLKIFFKGKVGESYNVGSNKNVKNITIVVLVSLIIVITFNKETYGNYSSKCYPGYEKANAYNSYFSKDKGWCINSSADISNDSTDVGSYDSDGNYCPNSKQLSAFDSIETDTKGWCDVPHADD